MTAQQVRNVSEIIWREDLYPRIVADPATIQRYADNLSVLPPIEVNQNNILIDGFHRWTAHRKAECETIAVTVTETASEAEVYALAIRRNSAHGNQLSEPDKRKAAIRLYAAGTGLDKHAIAETLSVSERSVSNYLNDVDKQLREQRKERIFDMWMAGATQDEIAPVVGLSPDAVGLRIKECREMEGVPNIGKVQAQFQDADFTAPLYNVWTFAKKTNGTNHFGNSEQRILENLLYLYTEPFDIVLDPFAGGGATIDVCKKRLRRYWVSDRKPIVEREREIRKLDIATDLPSLNKRWSEVTLTYLDPPYWRQAAGQYSDDAEDLANMPLEQFNRALAGVVNRIAEKQSRGVIALLLQPTQWLSDNRQFTDHVIDLVNAVGNRRLIVENRISCPYSTEQYNAQQVEWAKANRKLLVLTRELIVWRVTNGN